MSDSSHDRSPDQESDVTPLPADDRWSAPRPTPAPSASPELAQAPQLAPASELAPAPAAASAPSEVLQPEAVPPETDARVAALLRSIDQGGLTPATEKARPSIPAKNFWLGVLVLCGLLALPAYLMLDSQLLNQASTEVGLRQNALARCAKLEGGARTSCQANVNARHGQCALNVSELEDPALRVEGYRTCLSGR